jgi:hypothetical protein
VPAVVVAETFRGGPTDAPVNRLLKAVGRVDVADEAIGRTTGAAARERRFGGDRRCVVVATAIEGGGAVILTGDAGHLGTLAAGDPQVIIERL